MTSHPGPTCPAVPAAYNPGRTLEDSVPDLLQSLDATLDTQRLDFDRHIVRHARSYRCRCGLPLFFDNTLCLACQSPLGYLPDEDRIAALDPGPDAGTWHAPERPALLKFCANRESPAACNWMLQAANPRSLTRSISSS